jgi:hypothetical protein
MTSHTSQVAGLLFDISTGEFTGEGSPETVAERIDLDIANVYHALSYYHDHPKEMREVEQQRQNAIESAQEKTANSPPDDQG